MSNSNVWQKSMHVLGIETSCDETAAAVVCRDADGNGKIFSNVIRSQEDQHAPFGGVVPEIAARAHIEILDDLIEKAMDEAEMDFSMLDGIAATAGPGLISGLIVGLMTAKGLAFASGKPLIAVNHLEGHALTARLTDGLAFPYLLLLVSGGHTQFVIVRSLGNYQRLGTTIDDALGEAFDKTAKLLGLPFPGGPAVESAAKTGNSNRFKFPRPLKNRSGIDMSFAGLKTAVRIQAQEIAPVSEQDVADICASFQEAVAEVLAQRTSRALSFFTNNYPDVPCVFVIAGGVAANKHIRSALEEVVEKENARLVAPPAKLCTDNGAMIAWAGIERLLLGITDSLAVSPRSRWPLDELSKPVVGSGRRGAKV